MDRGILIEILNNYLADGIILLEKPTPCVLIDRDFPDNLFGYSMGLSVNNIKRTLFISSSCRPNLHGASSLLKKVVPGLKIDATL